MSKVSVIIPTYNRGRFICEAVASVLAQSRPPDEILVVDDGSTDETSDLLRQRFGDQIRYVRQDRQGRSAARNLGAKIARNEYLAFLDSDDVWTTRKLERQLETVEKDSTIAMIHCFTKAIDEQGKPTTRLTDFHLVHHQRAYQRGYSYETLSLECIIFPSCVVIRRDVFLDLGGFDTNIERLEDWELFLRVALVNKIAVVPEPLVLYRHHADQSGDRALTHGRIRVCKKHLGILNAMHDQPFWRRARRNFAIQLAESCFILGNHSEARRWLWEAVGLDLSLLFRPIWGRHFLLPHLVISYLPVGLASRARTFKQKLLGRRY